MRKFVFCFALLLVGCSGNSSDESSFAGTAQHVPEIAALALLPNTATYMEGDGNVIVNAEITFRDTGLDIQTLYIAMPDGTRIEFNESPATVTGTLTENLVMSTNKIGAVTVEFWLVDKAGESSVHRTADFSVLGDAQNSDWTSRLSGLPYALNDVIWDGDVFIAVGGSGAILTSSDGIEWVTHESGTNADLNSVAAYGAEIFAAGREVVLLSTDHGKSWITKNQPNSINVSAIAINSSQVIAGGFSYGLAASIIMISEDRGDTWQPVDSWPAQGYFLTDIIFRNGLFVATTDSSISSNGAKIQVSTDGKSWNEIVVREETAGLYAIVHDGSQFITAGGDSAVFTAFDGFNWMEMQTPIEEVDYLSAAWNGSKLLLAGGISWWYWWGGVTPPFERPVGISSTDGAVTWDVFNIDGYFESRGLAWGNGRFVSVGQSTPVSGEGAIYTAD